MDILYNMATEKTTDIIGVIFLVSVFGMALINEKIRKNRRLFRFGHCFSALSGMITCLFLTITSGGKSLDKGAQIVFLVFVLLIGLPIFLYNFNYLIRGEGEILTSTLVNCKVKRIRGGKRHHRVNYRVDGKSLENNKDSFLFRYKADKDIIRSRFVTDETRIIVEYYANSYSIYRVTREDGKDDI